MGERKPTQQRWMRSTNRAGHAPRGRSEALAVRVVLIILGKRSSGFPTFASSCRRKFPRSTPAACLLRIHAERRAWVWFITASPGMCVVRVGAGTVLGIALVATHAARDVREQAPMIHRIASIALFPALLFVAANSGSDAPKLTKHVRPVNGN